MRGNTAGGRVELRPGTPRRLKMAPPDRLKMAPPDRIASNASGGGSRFAGPGTGGSFSWDARVSGRQVGSKLVPFSPQTDAVLRRTYGPLYGGLGFMAPTNRPKIGVWSIATMIAGGVAAALSYQRNQSVLWALGAWIVWPASLPYYLLTRKK